MDEPNIWTHNKFINKSPAERDFHISWLSAMEDGNSKIFRWREVMLSSSAIMVPTVQKSSQHQYREQSTGCNEFIISQGMKQYKCIQGSIDYFFFNLQQNVIIKINNKKCHRSQNEDNLFVPSTFLILVDMLCIGCYKFGFWPLDTHWLIVFDIHRYIVVSTKPIPI